MSDRTQKALEGIAESLAGTWRRPKHITRGYRPFPCATEDTIPEGLRIALREPYRVHLDPLPADAEDLIREAAAHAMRVAGIQQVYPNMGQAGMGNPQQQPIPDWGPMPPYGGGSPQWYGAGFNQSPFRPGSFVPWHPPPKRPIPGLAFLKKLFKR